MGAIEHSNLLDQFNELYKFGASIDPGRAVTGIDLFRYFEYAIPLGWIKEYTKGHLDILDIGSSSTIWPVLLHSLLESTIHATDIDMDHLDLQRHLLYGSGRWDEFEKSFLLERQDATNLDYPNESFDIVSTISAIEHIPGEGDILAFREAERVLRSNGLFIITAPSAIEFEEHDTDYYHHGYEKRYDQLSIDQRFSSDQLIRKQLVYINGNRDSEKFIDKWYSGQKYNRYGKISSYIALRKFYLTDTPSEKTMGFMALYQKH